MVLMGKTANALLYGLLLILAAVFAGVAVMMPAPFGAVDQATLRYAGWGSEKVSERARLLMDFNKTGAAERLAQALPDEADAGARAEILAQVQAVEAENPQYRITGGAAPYFEQWLQGAPQQPADGSASVMHLLASSANRRDLLEFLSGTGNPAVRQLLETRRMTGTAHFLPVGTAGGAPLEASILTTALLAQANYLQPDVLRELTGWAYLANAGDAEGVARLEAFYLAILGAGRQCDWVQFAEWVRTCERAESLQATVSLHRRFPEKLPVLYAAVLLSDNPAGVAQYLQSHALEEGWRDLEYALDQGRDALHLLLEKNQPVYRPPNWLAWRAQWMPEALVRWSLQHHGWVQAMRVGAFFLAGLFLALFLSRLARVEVPGEIRMWHPLDFFRHSLLATVAAVILLYAAEPNLLAARAELPAHLNFKVFLAGSETPVSPMNPNEFDQITLLILLLFFVLQVILYLICLIRIARIKRQQASAPLKARLLENEEPLFDSGLYVGLGGTVASLISLAMGIVQASLIAAYASTLFGILFVAVLKILHVRPYRRKLILEAEKTGDR